MNDTWMKVAHNVAEKSKDPRTKVGAVIVDEDDRIVSTGRNGMVRGCNEKGMWDNKYPFVIHAEMNAAIFARRYLGGCQVYITMSPCINCLKHLLQMGVRVIHYAKVYERYTEEEKKDLKLLLNSTNCLVRNSETMQVLQGEL